MTDDEFMIDLFYTEVLDQPIKLEMLKPSRSWMFITGLLD